jgi:hypothetical protein
MVMNGAAVAAARGSWAWEHRNPAAIIIQQE